MGSNQEQKHEHPTIILFAPESWGTVTRFSKFAHTTFRFRKKTVDALRGVDGHFQKYLTLHRLAERLAPTLGEDLIELEERHYSSCKRSREVAALVETLFCELYSTLDCMREVLRAVLRSPSGKAPQGIPKQKTSKLFSNAADGKLAQEVPAPITAALTQAQSTWFPRLRDIRTHVVHFDVGRCHLGSDDKVFYMNVGLGSNDRAFVIEDVFGRLTEFQEGVNRLLGIVFAVLFKRLDDVRSRQICCLHKSRVYQRMISPREVLDGGTGVCFSYKWFGKDSGLTCPLADSCRAYAQVKSQTST